MGRRGKRDDELLEAFDDWYLSPIDEPELRPGVAAKLKNAPKKKVVDINKKDRMVRQKRRDPLQYFPREITDNILLRLRILELVNLKSVCKTWHRKISDLESVCEYIDCSRPMIIKDRAIYETGSRVSKMMRAPLHYMDVSDGWFKSMDTNHIELSTVIGRIKGVMTEAKIKRRSRLEQLLNVWDSSWEEHRYFNSFNTFDKLDWEILDGLKVLQIVRHAMFPVLKIIVKNGKLQNLRELDIFNDDTIYDSHSASNWYYHVRSDCKDIQFLTAHDAPRRYHKNMRNLKIGGQPGFFGSDFGTIDQVGNKGFFPITQQYLEVLTETFPYIHQLVLANINVLEGTSRWRLMMRMTNPELRLIQLYDSNVCIPILPSSLEVLKAIWSKGVPHPLLPSLSDCGYPLTLLLDDDGLVKYQEDDRISTLLDEYKNVQHLSLRHFKAPMDKFLDIICRFGSNLRILQIDGKPKANKNTGLNWYNEHRDDAYIFRSDPFARRRPADGGPLTSGVHVMSLVVHFCPNLTHLSLKGRDDLIDRNSIRALSRLKHLEFADLSEIKDLNDGQLQILLWGASGGSPRVNQADLASDDWQKRFKDALILKFLKLIRLDNCLRISHHAIDVVKCMSIKVEASHL
ncbi:hypothetical protein V1512DRAFT_245015 [Lipomyces arxii]|uniref:uncharacterized protein n=1 Tax=Lipomyces arxii TaxID=56418 RepID=UPI0034CFD09A